MCDVDIGRRETWSKVQEENPLGRRRRGRRGVKHKEISWDNCHSICDNFNTHDNCKFDLEMYKCMFHWWNCFHTFCKDVCFATCWSVSKSLVKDYWNINANYSSFCFQFTPGYPYKHLGGCYALLHPGNWKRDIAGLDLISNLDLTKIAALSKSTSKPKFLCHNLICKVEPEIVWVDRQPGGRSVAEPGILLIAPL